MHILTSFVIGLLIGEHFLPIMIGLIKFIGGTVYVIYSIPGWVYRRLRYHSRYHVARAQEK